MDQHVAQKTLLEHLRVVDLTDEKGYLCGKILGDMGADVIKVERPGGDPGRRLGPFFHDVPHPEHSLFWWAFNLNKRGITLNIDCADGRELLRMLVAGADILIESCPPGHMEEIGLGYEALKEVNRRLVMTSITWFGKDGPYADYKGSDLVAMAMGGFMAVAGDCDRPPVRISSPQSCLNACAEGAAGTMLAHYVATKVGQGQHVDVSVQASIVLSTLNNIPFWLQARRILKRVGSSRIGLGHADLEVRQQWPCRDGFVAFDIRGGAYGAKTNRALSEWMDAEGMGDDFLRSMDWDHLDMGRVAQETMWQIEGPVARFIATKTKTELYEGSVQRRIQLYPVYNTKDIIKDAQLSARGFWVGLEHPELGETVVYPGSFARSSRTSLDLRRRAPLIGEHNRDIFLGELGLSESELIVLKQSGVI